MFIGLTVVNICILVITELRTLQAPDTAEADFDNNNNGAINSRPYSRKSLCTPVSERIEARGTVLYRRYPPNACTVPRRFRDLNRGSSSPRKAARDIGIVITFKTRPFPLIMSVVS